MGKKKEIINNTDVDDVNSIKSDDDNVMENLKDLVSNLSKKGKKKSKKEEEIVIDEDDSEDDDSEDDDSGDDDSGDDDSEDDDSEDDDSEDDDSEEEGYDELNNNGIAVIASLIQESLYDSEGISIGESLSKGVSILEKWYNLEKKKYKDKEKV